MDPFVAKKWIIFAYHKLQYDNGRTKSPMNILKATYEELFKRWGTLRLLL